MRTCVLVLALFGCSQDDTFALRSEVDPQRPLTVKVTAKVPDSWPSPRLNEKYGWPQFSLPGPSQVVLRLDQVRGTTAQERVAQSTATSSIAMASSASTDRGAEGG